MPADQPIASATARSATRPLQSTAAMAYTADPACFDRSGWTGNGRLPAEGERLSEPRRCTEGGMTAATKRVITPTATRARKPAASRPWSRRVQDRLTTHTQNKQGCWQLVSK